MVALIKLLVKILKIIVSITKLGFLDETISKLEGQLPSTIA